MRCKAAMLSATLVAVVILAGGGMLMSFDSDFAEATGENRIQTLADGHSYEFLGIMGGTNESGLDGNTYRLYEGIDIYSDSQIDGETIYLVADAPVNIMLDPTYMAVYGTEGSGLNDVGGSLYGSVNVGTFNIEDVGGETESSFTLVVMDVQHIEYMTFPTYPGRAVDVDFKAQLYYLSERSYTYSARIEIPSNTITDNGSEVIAWNIVNQHGQWIQYPGDTFDVDDYENEELNAYAIFALEPHPDLDGGVGDITSADFVYEIDKENGKISLTMPEVEPSKEGYEFVGWNIVYNGYGAENWWGGDGVASSGETVVTDISNMPSITFPEYVVTAVWERQIQPLEFLSDPIDNGVVSYVA